MKFEHQFIETDPGFDGWGAVVVADFDGDGRPEFATGGKGGGIYCLYDFDPERGEWDRSVISDAFSPNVGAAALDADGDGRLEIVCGEWGSRLLWFGQSNGGWDCRTVGDGLVDPHDVLSGDVNGDGRDEVIVREKDGRLVIYYPSSSELPWRRQVVASDLSGDGTCLASLALPSVVDIVTNMGWFENVNGDGTEWVRHPLIPEDLGWHPESRIAVADVDGDGQLEVVITESEIGQARLAILKAKDKNHAWRSRVLIDRDQDMRAFHTLQLVDLDGDGELEIFTAEMENGKTDGILAKPKWMALSRTPGDAWISEVVFDSNLGTHSAGVGDFDGDGKLDLVGKVWRANAVNGNGGRNHIDFLRQV
jgi:hypothetical protein